MKRKQGAQSASSFFSVLTQQPNEKYIKGDDGQAIGKRQLGIIKSIREEAETEKLKQKLCDETGKLEKEEENIQNSAKIYAKHTWSDTVELMKDLSYDFDSNDHDPNDNSREFQWFTNLANANPPLYMGHESSDEPSRQCGVLTDINSCWERQGKIFRIVSLEPGAKTVEIDLKFSKVIESVTVAGPLKRISKSGDNLGIIIIYKDKLLMLLYSQSTGAIKNNGLWTDIPQTARPFSVVATKSGRVFFGGNDGHIYELMSRKTRYIFGKRNILLASCTSSWIPFLEGIKSLVKSPDPIIQLEVDESRQILYALRGTSSSIDIYSISKEKSLYQFSYVRTLTNLYSKAYSTTPFLLLSRECGPDLEDLEDFYGHKILNVKECWENIWDTYFKRFVVSIHPIPKQASVSFSLVAVTSQGALLYFTPSGILASVVLPPFTSGPVSAFHVSGPCFHSDGTLIIPFTKEKPVKENFILCRSFMNMGGKVIKPFVIYKIGDFEKVIRIHRITPNTKLNVPLPPSSISSKKEFKISHPYISQYYDEPQKYYVETTEGLRTCGRYWPIDELKRKMLSGKANLEKDILFGVVKPKEVYSMCLYIYSNAQSTKAINGSDKIVLIKAVSKIFETFTFDTKNTEELNNIRVDGIVAFISRVIQPILDSAICSAIKRGDATHSSGMKKSAWSKAQLEEAYLFLMNAHNFIKNLKSICSEPSVSSGLTILRIICETLMFISLMCNKGEVFSETIKQAKVGDNLCMRDLVFNKRIRSSIMTAFVSVLLDADDSDALDLMEKRCPFYSLCFKTSPTVREIYSLKGVSAQRSKSHILDDQNLEDSLERLINTPGIDIDFICTKYVKSNCHAGALRLAIAKGEKLNQNSSNSHSTSHELQLKSKKQCYIIAIRILNNFSGPIKTRDELVKLALSFKEDKDWNEMIWSWCINNNLKDFLIKYSPHSRLINYLMSRGDSHDTICKCYMEDGDQEKAFEFLVSSAISNNAPMHISKRMELLRSALAITTHTRAINQQNVMKTRFILSIVALQNDIYERLKKKYMQDIKGSDIENKVIHLEVLRNSYAMRYKLYDLVIEAMKIGNDRKKESVEKIYIEMLFVQGLDNYAMPDILKMMGSRFYNKEDDFFFPVEFLMEQLFLRGFLNSNVIHKLRDCGVPYFAMFSYLKMKKHDSAAVLIINTCTKDLIEGGDCSDISVEQLLYMKDCLLKCGSSKDSVMNIDNVINLVNNYNKSKLN